MARSERYALKRDREIFPVRCALVSFILIISEKEKAANKLAALVGFTHSRVTLLFNLHRVFMIFTCKSCSAGGKWLT